MHVSPQVFKAVAAVNTGSSRQIPFCLNCGQTHEVHGKDMNRLASLSGEGRSSATTILTLSAIRQLFAAKTCQPINLTHVNWVLRTTARMRPCRLGIFNDFVFLLTLRSALIGALQNHQGMLNEETLADAVFKALGFDKTDFGTLAEYLRTPKLMGLAARMPSAPCVSSSATGFCVTCAGAGASTTPTHQLNLLSIAYRGLDEFVAETSLFAAHPVLACISPEQRHRGKPAFDSMRRSLCLETRYLDPVEQDKAKATAHQYLNERWAFAADENLETAKYLILTKRPEYKGKPRTDLVPGGSRSRLLKDIKAAKFWKDSAAASQVATWKDPQWVELTEQLLQAASHYGYVHKLDVEGAVVGWRLNASSMDWMLVDETQAPKTVSTTSFSVVFIWLWPTPAPARARPVRL